GGGNPLSSFFDPTDYQEYSSNVQELMNEAIQSMERQRFKEALRSIMSIAQLGNSILQTAAPWEHLEDPDSDEARASLSALAYSWSLCRGLAVALRPFMPFQSDRLWEMLGEDDDIDTILWDESFSYADLNWNSDKPSHLFRRLDLDDILATELALAEDESNSKVNESDTVPGDSGGGYIEFEDFKKVEMRTGRISSVKDHPDADKLFVITIEDGPGTSRTVCAGLKGIIDASDLLGLNVVYVANLKPRKLRGVLSEGMLLAAEDEDGKVSVLTMNDDISPGSIVR
ncbi:MAG: class I tRNA ligase family protein, partial [Dehalococcoidia bacterium]|nr:class I tRNA ligase family protein [Dehalococcoidia bacterium]